MKKFRYYWQIFWQFRKIRAMTMLEFRGNFFFWTFISTMWATFNFFFFTLIVGVNGHIGGWSVPEMFVLQATFTLLDAMLWSYFYPNMLMFTKLVFSGELNFLLLKPIDTQFVVMNQDNGFDDFFRMVIGLAGLCWAIPRLGYQVGNLQWLLFIILFIFANVLVYSLWMVIATFALWVERLDNINDVIPNIRRIWQMPRQVFTGVASTVFTVLIPIGLVSSIPSEVLLGKSVTWWPVYFVGFAICTLIFSRWWLKFSLRRYTGVAN